MKLAVAATALLGIGTALALGFYLTGIGVRNVRYAAASVRWPTAKGIVAGAERSRQVSRDRETGIDSVAYSADLTVVYQVAGVDRATDLLRFGETLGSSDPSEAELRLVRYPAGTGVAVSYHPSKPWIACVKPGLHADAFWLPCAGLAFILPGVMALFVLYGFRRAGAHGGDMGMAIAAGLFASIFCALGVLGLAGGAGRIWNGYNSRHWPVAEGEIMYSSVTASESRDEETHRVSTTFSSRFVYRYQVAGEVHFNNLRRFGRIEGSGPEWADEIAANYPRGRKVRVRYSPADPDVAVLEPGNTSEALWLPGLALAALLLGIGAFVIVVPAIARG